MALLKNTRHELFAQAVASGRSTEEAYRLAGFTPSRANGNRLKCNEAVRSRITELQCAMAARMQKKVAYTREWVEEQLIDNIEKAKSKGDFSAANQALRLLGIEKQMFVEKRETGKPGEFNDLDNAGDIVEAIRKQLGDKAAAALAAVLGDDDDKAQEDQPLAQDVEPTNEGTPALN